MIQFFFQKPFKLFLLAVFLESTLFIFCYPNLFFDVLHCMFSIFIKSRVTCARYFDRCLAILFSDITVPDDYISMIIYFVCFDCYATKEMKGDYKFKLRKPSQMITR